MGVDTSKKLVIWDSAAVPNACVLWKHSEIEDPWELVEGVPRAATFPADCTYAMHPDFLHNTLLVDNLINTDRLVVVSLRLKQFLEARGIKQLEFLPVTIMDLRERPASRDYFIVHPIEHVDCLDLEKSGARFSAIDPETIPVLVLVPPTPVSHTPVSHPGLPRFVPGLSLSPVCPD